MAAELERVAGLVETEALPAADFVGFVRAPRAWNGSGGSFGAAGFESVHKLNYLRAHAADGSEWRRAESTRGPTQIVFSSEN